METSIFKNAMQECETAIRNLKPHPEPKDVYLIGELVNYWLKNFNLCTLFNKETDNESEKNK